MRTCMMKRGKTGWMSRKIIASVVSSLYIFKEGNVMTYVSACCRRNVPRLIWWDVPMPGWSEDSGYSPATSRWRCPERAHCWSFGGRCYYYPGHYCIYTLVETSTGNYSLVETTTEQVKNDPRKNIWRALFELKRRKDQLLNEPNCRQSVFL